jgi:hypothetical protein
VGPAKGYGVHLEKRPKWLVMENERRSLWYEELRAVIYELKDTVELYVGVRFLVGCLDSLASLLYLLHLRSIFQTTWQSKHIESYAQVSWSSEQLPG